MGEVTFVSSLSLMKEEAGVQLRGLRGISPD